VTPVGRGARNVQGKQPRHAGQLSPKGAPCPSDIDLFERRFSVDETVKRHKPAQEAYHSVATALQIEPGNICLLAAHVWDTIGAQSAGWQAGLILRDGNAPLGVGPQPGYVGKDLDAIADQLIERYPQ
jgi:2-haloacid dehalogenase